MNRTQILSAKQIQQKLFHLAHGNENVVKMRYFFKNMVVKISFFFANFGRENATKIQEFEMKISSKYAFFLLPVGTLKRRRVSVERHVCGRSERLQISITLYTLRL